MSTRCTAFRTRSSRRGPRYSPVRPVVKLKRSRGIRARAVCLQRRLGDGRAGDQLPADGDERVVHLAARARHAGGGAAQLRRHCAEDGRGVCPGAAKGGQGTVGSGVGCDDCQDRLQSGTHCRAVRISLGCLAWALHRHGAGERTDLFRGVG